MKSIYTNAQHKKLLLAELEKTELLAQNKRLLNFAHMVSHNLRSHAGNLQSLLELIKVTDTDTERRLLMDSLYKLSESLWLSISHLSEVVKMQTGPKITKSPVALEAVFEETIAILVTNINESGTVIDADFSDCPVIESVPAYMESILLNLISNAIKYRHPDRTPEITVRSFVCRNKSYITIEDNGLGFDLPKYKDQVFGMYKTFHHHPEARGLGLFITRSQVEALNGSIAVESEVNKGSRFTIAF